MNEPTDIIEERLNRLANLTQNIRPRPGFEDRVLFAVTWSAAVDWRVGLWRLGRYGLVLSVIAVTLATAFAVQGANREDEMQAMAYGTVDLEW